MKSLTQQAHFALPNIKPRTAMNIIKNRNDLWLGFTATLATIIMAVIAAQPVIAGWELSLFRLINTLPDFLYWLIWPFMQYGVFVTIPIVAAVALYFRRYRLAIMLLLGGICIYFGALVLKQLVDRGRPADIISGVITREQFRYLSLGFTSGHAAVAATIATFAHRYLSRTWQVVSLITLGFVVFGRMYIGGHFPLDVFAGITLGLAFASWINYAFGTPKPAAKSRAAQALTLRKIVRIHRPRHPGDIVRVVIGCLIFCITTVLALTGQISRLEEYLLRLVNYLPSFLSPFFQVVMQAGAFYFVPIATVLALLYRHPRLAIKISAGGSLVWILAKIAKSLVQRDRPHYLLSGIVERAQNSGILGFPSGHASVAAFLATVASGYMKKGWSRLAWIAVWSVAVSRMFVGAHLPLDVFAGIAMGWMVGSVFNLLLGTPDRPLPRRELLATLKEAGLKVKNLKVAHVDARGSSPMFAQTFDGQKLFVKVINNEHRNADILFKLWRYFTLREVEDEAPFTTAKHLVEHEAYLYNQAAAAHMRTPRVRLAAPIALRAAVLVSDKIDGTTLDSFQGPLTSRLLKQVMRQVLAMQRAHIAHRDLRSANIIIDETHKPWIIDFSFAESAASQRRLNIDIVEIMASLALLVSPRKVARAAVDVLGKKTISEALPYMQLATLTSTTRRKYKKQVRLLDDLRNHVQLLTGSRDVAPINMKRFSYHTFIWLLLGILVIYFVVTQVSSLDNYITALKGFHPVWMASALLASIFTYCMSAIVLLGASKRSLAFGRTLLLQSATSFVNRLTPKSIGGVTITERFLEKSTLRRAEAMAAISVAYFSGIVVHVVLSLVVVVGIAQHPLHIDMPEGWALVGVMISLSLLLSLTFIPKIKRAFKDYIKEGYLSLRQVFTVPTKAMQLIGGSLGVTLSYALALFFSVVAFGVSLPFEDVLLVYLAGSAVASVSPTPGGLGAAEASLAGGLVVFGVPSSLAVVSVLAFRFVTYWLPIIPGIFAFRHLHKQHMF